MNERLLNKLGLEVGGSHFPTVFADYQEAYVKKVLQQCYHVMLNSQEKTDSYLAVDLMFDICKHFELNPALLYKNNEKIWKNLSGMLDKSAESGYNASVGLEIESNNDKTVWTTVSEMS